MRERFSLFLFSTDTAFITRAVAGGADGVIVDWEYAGKETRQRFADTQINRDTPEDLRRVRGCIEATVICRVNAYGETTAVEVEQAIEAGADEILLPMVRTVEDVEDVLEKVRGRCGVGILIETVAAVASAKEFSRLPLSRVYVGLNDLAIGRRTPNIFSSVADGTVERVRAAFDVPFGFAGLTLPDRGHPIPCRLLIGEMARLGCRFSFLRRSFHRDIRGRDPAVEIPRLSEAIRFARFRPAETVKRDRMDLENAVSAWTAALSPVEEHA
ncbi:MAG: hypothetical protein HZA60_06725 [Deltaproteobacteria bacterium]|nr:hypothetical protein [Deltaproteobacteria bacterium]